MFGLEWDRWLLLIVVALFVLGPERLPAAARWVGTSVRRVKSFVADAQAKLNDELGPELTELRTPLADLPLAELRRLRNPRAAVSEFLFAEPTVTTPPAPTPRAVTTPTPPSGAARPAVGLAHGARPPIDMDAT